MSTPLELTPTKTANVVETASISLSSIPYVTVLGVRFHCLWMHEALQTIETFIQQRQPRHICLSNAYTLAISQYDSEFKTTLNRADLVLPDGMSIVWGSRWIGVRLPQRIAGPDLTTALCERAAQKGYSIFLMGSSAENLDQLKKVLLKRWPTLRILGDYSPSMCERIGEAENETILARIYAVQPDILFVGMSAPKQEKWISDNLAKINVPVSIGIGAAFDFLSGRIPRAPALLQESGLEWLHRLWCEPQRLWRRYLLGNAVFLSLLLTERVAQKLFQKRSTPSS